MACIRNWIAESLKIDESDTRITDMIRCFNQVLPGAAMHAVQEITPKFNEGLIFNLNGQTPCHSYKAAFDMRGEEIVLAVSIDPPLFSGKMNVSMPLGETTYEYALKPAIKDGDPPSFELTQFDCKNEDYKSLLDPLLDEKTRHDSGFRVLHDLAVNGAPIPKTEFSSEFTLADKAEGILALIQAADTLKVVRDLSNINAENLDFNNADFKNAILVNANFKGADFRGADLSGVDFSGCNLTDVDFRGANLTGANFTGAILNGMIIDEKTVFKDIIDRCSLSEQGESDKDDFELIEIEKIKETQCAYFTFVNSSKENSAEINFSMTPPEKTQGFSEAPKMENEKDFVKDFLKEYAPPRKGPELFQKSTPITSTLKDSSVPTGSKVLKILSHAEDKANTFSKDKRNDTKKALDRVLGSTDSLSLSPKSPVTPQ